VEQGITKLEGQAAEQVPEYRNAEGGYGLLYPSGWYYTDRTPLHAGCHAPIDPPPLQSITVLPPAFSALRLVIGMV